MSADTQDTIFALASGFGKSGVAVVRISGNKAKQALTMLSGIQNPFINRAALCTLKTLDGKEVLDRALYLYFQAPKSYTGEDVTELHLHGGRAVVSAVLGELQKIKGLRLAEGGEFTRRAVLNNKMDITSAEGIGDLIEAVTFQQVKQALKQAAGELGDLYEAWRKDILHLLAYIEAYIDFPEEEVPETVLNELTEKIQKLQREIQEHLADNGRGQQLNEGYKIAIIGAPNAGKSSLLNRLVKKEAAIVSSLEGTTRDVIEVFMDLGGFPVIFSDTAGLREAENEIEAEGIKRALKRAESADLKLAVFDGKNYPVLDKATLKLADDRTLTIINKADIIKTVTPVSEEHIFISAKDGTGVQKLLDMITDKVKTELEVKEAPVITKMRHRTALEQAVEALTRAENTRQTDLKAEDLRLAARQIGILTGKINVDEVLDIVFKDFCIGK